MSKTVRAKPTGPTPPGRPGYEAPGQGPDPSDRRPDGLEFPADEDLEDEIADDFE